MTIEQIIVLAVVQGITEFLPISSSGHLILVPQLMHWPDQGQFVDVMTHLGTLLAVLIYFWRDVWRLIQGTLRAVHGQGHRRRPARHLYRARHHPGRRLRRRRSRSWAIPISSGTSPSSPGTPSSTAS